MAYKSQFTDQKLARNLPRTRIRARVESMARITLMAGVTYAEPFVQKKLIVDDVMPFREVDLSPISRPLQYSTPQSSTPVDENVRAQSGRGRRLQNKEPSG